MTGPLPCEWCGDPATATINGVSWCSTHLPDGVRQASRLLAAERGAPPDVADAVERFTLEALDSADRATGRAALVASLRRARTANGLLRWAAVAGIAGQVGAFVLVGWQGPVSVASLVTVVFCGWAWWRSLRGRRELDVIEVGDDASTGV